MVATTLRTYYPKAFEVAFELEAVLDTIPSSPMLISQRGVWSVRYTITRRSRPGRGRMVTRRVSVPAGKVSIRLPRAVKGHALAPGRYRVTVTVVDTLGNRSRTVRRSFVVRAARG